MKIIHHINGVVVDIINVRHDASMESLALVESIPTYEAKNGYNGVLMYGDNGLYWVDVAIPETNEITDAEALNIIVGGDEK